jgi:ribosomal protein S18 acetylase RimI-like enzyme
VQDDVLVGAAWYRYWTDDHNTRGYINAHMPVVVIGVERDYRRQGVGKQLLARLIHEAANQGIPQISLSVTKDNHALQLYQQQGFVTHTDIGDSLLMVCQTQQP